MKSNGGKKPVSLGKLTLKDANSGVRIRNKLSEGFEIKEGGVNLTI